MKKEDDRRLARVLWMITALLSILLASMSAIQAIRQHGELLDVLVCTTWAFAAGAHFTIAVLWNKLRTNATETEDELSSPTNDS